MDKMKKVLTQIINNAANQHLAFILTNLIFVSLIFSEGNL